jgi:putative membrane protein
VIVPLAHVGGGVVEPLQLLAPLAALGAYAWRTRTLARQGRPVPLWRTLCFAAGIALIVAALVTPVAHLGEELILAHMAQHVAMADLATLLMVLGLTGPLLQPVLATRVVRRLRVLAHPVVAFALWAIDLYVWHIPALYEASLSSELVHAVQHGTFVLFGFNMWLALLGPLPQPEWFGNGARLLYIVGVRFTGALLGNVFLWSESVFYPAYRPGQAEWEISALQDQGVAGTIMMVESSIVTVVLLGWLFVKAARESEEKQSLLELASARGVDLSEKRAARAVASGRGEELRRRLERAATG